MPDREVFYEDVSGLVNPIELTQHKGDENFTERDPRRVVWRGSAGTAYRPASRRADAFPDKSRRNAQVYGR